MDQADAFTVKFGCPFIYSLGSSGKKYRAERGKRVLIECVNDKRVVVVRVFGY